MVNGLLDYVADVDKRLKEKDHQIKVLEKALQLSVKYMFEELKIKDCEDLHYDGNYLTLLEENIGYFKELAEKELRDGEIN